MARIRMYSTTWCGYCVRAKALLERRGLEYEEIVMDDDPSFRQKMLEMTGRWYYGTCFQWPRHPDG